MQLIADSQGVAELCAELAGVEYVTVDTEFMRERTYWPILCLVQLAGPERAAAIDPLAPGIDLEPLRRLMLSPKVLKVLHSGRQDIEIFLKLWDTVPAPLFDTQAAAAVCGFGDQVGLEPLIHRLTGQRLDKASRFTDWARRPLSPRQIAYALGDVVHLRHAYEKLRAQLEASGRASWLEEEMAELVDPATYRSDPEEIWRRLKPRTADRRSLAILKAIAAWREREAMARDLPRGFVVKDEALLEIAAHPPTDLAGLQHLRGVPKGFAEGRLGLALVEAVKRGLALPEEAAPQPRQEARLPRGVGAIADLLKVLLKQKCDQNHVAQRLVATGAELDRIAEEGEADVPALKGWRREVFGADALRLVMGEVGLAVAGEGVALVEIAGGKAETPTGPLNAPRRRRRRRRRAGAPGAGPPATD